MKVINIFGGPNAGKSTTAAGLFYAMKIRGHNVELVTEYAKTMVFEKRDNILQDQLYILAKQNRALERLRDVDWVVTDSPIILGVVYAKQDYYDNFKSVALDAWNTYENRNFYLTSKIDLPYQTSGRLQTQEQAKRINDQVNYFLIDNHVDFNTIRIIPDIVDPFQNHVAKILHLLV